MKFIITRSSHMKLPVGSEDRQHIVETDNLKTFLDFIDDQGGREVVVHPKGYGRYLVMNADRIDGIGDVRVLEIVDDLRE